MGSQVICILFTLSVPRSSAVEAYRFSLILLAAAGQIRLIAAILNGAKFIERQIGILAVKVLTETG
ncbi:Uncharacterised protein [Salmonella enterica subsp. enterica]|uniref:Uncharacterized protein n=1 Tax=Salmonella enterica I TaxID=59201 RepID=A0A379WHA2_SALET|nr:Uncharacterised protein [Salmonella enterica subsp. enterica]